MQIPVLPRDVAGRIITSAVSRMGWAVGAVTIVLAIPVLIETLARRDRIDDLPVPLAMLGLMLIGICIVFGSGAPVVGLRSSSRWPASAAVVYDLALLLPDPRLLDEAVFLINRPAVALVTVGVTAVSPLIGVLWATLGYGVVVGGRPSWSRPSPTSPSVPGSARAWCSALAVVGYLTLAGIQIAQRRSLPDFDDARGRDAAARPRRGPGAQDDRGRARHRAQRPLARDERARRSSSQRARDRLLEDLATLRERRVARLDDDDPHRQPRRRHPAQRHHAHHERLPVARA